MVQDRAGPAHPAAEATALVELSTILVACGVRSVTQPELHPTRAALRNVLRALILPGALGAPDASTAWLRRIRLAREPRMARYHLACALCERPPLPWDVVERAGGAAVYERWQQPEDEVHAFLGDEDPDHPPVLPPGLSGAALVLLGQMEAEETEAEPQRERRPHNAFNVLRAVAPAPRWPSGIREAMQQVIDQRVADSSAFASHVLALADFEGRLRTAGEGREEDPRVGSRSETRLAVVRLEITGETRGAKHHIVLNGREVYVGDGLFGVLKMLAYQHALNPSQPCSLPTGKDARKRTLTRLSDLRTSKSRLSRALRSVLDSLPAPLIDPKECRFNPALKMDITLP